MRHFERASSVGGRAILRGAAWVGGIFLSIVFLYGTSAGADSSSQRLFLDGLGLSTNRLEKIGASVFTADLAVENSRREAALLALVRIDPAGDEVLNSDTAGWSSLMDSPLAEGLYDSERADRGLGELKLPDSDLDLLASCQIGKCRFKLDALGIGQALAAQEDAEATEAQLLSAVQGGLARLMEEYRSGGPENLSPYADKPGSPSRSKPIRQLEQSAQEWLRFYPDLNHHLETFPANTTNSVTDRLQWNVSSVGLRDTVLLEHVMWANAGKEPGFGRAMVLRTLYASHYLEARLQIAMVLDGPTLFGQPGTFLLTIDRVHFDEDVGFIKKRLLNRALSQKARERLTGVHQQSQTAG
ncbi:MAG: hypothetical protein P8M78_12510 [Myxococcota bacterium]|nr:hypothetical protein [Myxococcota bacterium]